MTMAPTLVTAGAELPHIAEAGPALLDERGLSKLRWRCRRGLLENDLFIERFFGRYGDTLSVPMANALGRLMELSDNDLLDVQLARKSLVQVDPQLDTEDVHVVLKMLKEPL